MIFERAPRVLNNRYHLHLQLGAGGQASVWLGEDDLLKRRVAIKQLVPQDGGEDIVAVRQRALREARAMALVRHRAIVPIHDILFTGGDADTGDPWLVMEFVDGSTLQSLIDDGPLDDATIARIEPRGPRRPDGGPPGGHRAPRRQAGQHLDRGGTALR